ncbi:MAG: hypothetical protein ACI8QH_000809 [Flammeovirgaceae bacterium]|jgi:hypothetical protein
MSRKFFVVLKKPDKDMCCKEDIIRASRLWTIVAIDKGMIDTKKTQTN